MKVEDLLTPAVKNLLELRSFIFPLDWIPRYGKDFLSSVLAVVFGSEIAQAASESEQERFARARALFGIGPKISHSYIFGPGFALDDGGLAFVRRVFGDSPAAVIVRNPEEETFVKEFNQRLAAEGLSTILIAHDIAEAQQALLREQVNQRGGIRAGTFTLWGVAKSTEPTAEVLKQALRDNLTLVTTELFRRFAEISGLESLAAEFRAQFELGRSA